MTIAPEDQKQVRLALCSVGELFGGVERHLLGTCSWLLRQGIAPRLVLFHDRELARQARALGVQPEIIAAAGALDLRSPRRLSRYLADQDVNVVHAHGYKAVVTCALARRHHSFALLRTVHGLVEPRRGLGLAGLRSRLYTWLERRAGRRAGAAVTYVTDDLRLRHENLDRGLVTRTVYNGIDPLRREDYPRPAELKPGPFHLVAVGRISEVKGLEYALRAMADLAPGHGVVLNVLGTGPLETELKALAAELGLTEHVRWLGFRQDIYGFLAHADALLMPSLHEGLPYTLLEAMSLGMPIIAAAVGGLQEVLTDRQTALLVAPRSVDDLVRSITFVRDNPGEAEALGRAARLLQQTEFALNTTCESMFEVVQAVLRNHQSGR